MTCLLPSGATPAAYLHSVPKPNGLVSTTLPATLEDSLRRIWAGMNAAVAPTTSLSLGMNDSGGAFSRDTVQCWADIVPAFGALAGKSVQACCRRGLLAPASPAPRPVPPSQARIWRTGGSNTAGSCARANMRSVRSRGATITRRTELRTPRRRHLRRRKRAHAARCARARSKEHRFLPFAIRYRRRKLPRAAASLHAVYLHRNHLHFHLHLYRVACRRHFMNHARLSAARSSRRYHHASI